MGLKRELYRQIGTPKGTRGRADVGIGPYGRGAYRGV